MYPEFWADFLREIGFIRITCQNGKDITMEALFSHLKLQLGILTLSVVVILCPESILCPEQLVSMTVPFTLLVFQEMFGIDGFQVLVQLIDN
jgi:hypothetical protein